MNAKPRILVAAVVTLVVILLALPTFFSTYRAMVFQTIPRDDYAPYLLYLTGERDEYEPTAPLGYRLFSVAIAIPFYEILPAYSFTNLDEPDLPYLKATEAIAFVSFLAMLISCYLVYLITRRKLNASTTTSLLAAAISFLLFGYTALYAVDSIAIMIIALLVYLIDRPWWFALIAVSSVGFNEKIPLLILMLFAARFVFDPRQRRDVPQLLASVVAAAGYFGIRAIAGLPGHEHQTNPAEFLASIPEVMLLTFSAKGLVLILAPCLLLAGAYFLAVRGSKAHSHPTVFSPADVIPLVGLLVLSLGAGVMYNVGRIAMYTFPLYIPAATLHLHRTLSRGPCS